MLCTGAGMGPPAQVSRPCTGFDGSCSAQGRAWHQGCVQSIPETYLLALGRGIHTSFWPIFTHSSHLATLSTLLLVTSALSFSSGISLTSLDSIAQRFSTVVHLQSCTTLACVIGYAHSQSLNNSNSVVVRFSWAWTPHAT